MMRICTENKILKLIDSIVKCYERAIPHSLSPQRLIVLFKRPRYYFGYK